MNYKPNYKVNIQETVLMTNKWLSNRGNREISHTAGHIIYIDTLPSAIFLTPVQFSSAPELHPTLCDPMDRSTPGFPVHHQLPEATQTHIHCIGNAIQWSNPLSFLFPPTFNLSQHQGLFQWVSSLHKMAKLLEFQL